MIPTKPLTVLGLVAGLFLLGGCDKTEASAIRLELSKDGSGVLTVTSLAAPSEPTNLESECSGVTFDARAAVVRVRGRVAAGASPVIAGIRCERGPSNLRIRIPRGADRKWASALAPTDAADRREVERATKTGGLGKSVRIEVRVPYEVTVHGFHPQLSRLKETVEQDAGVWVCALLLPVDLEKSDHDLIWDLAWRSE
ncbi:MAG: hypothetical protein CMJ83_00975 [Planctomycetes bacterium]|nr:hypothetical protein [Planctomycetota bacterium]